MSEETQYLKRQTQDESYNALTKFILVLKKTSENKDVQEACQKASIEPRGSTLLQVMLDDVMTNFIAIMQHQPDEKIPKEFYRMLISGRDNRTIDDAELDSHLSQALAEKRKPGNSSATLMPKVLRVLKEGVPPSIALGCRALLLNMNGHIARLVIPEETLLAEREVNMLLNMIMVGFGDLETIKSPATTSIPAPVQTRAQRQTQGQRNAPAEQIEAPTLQSILNEFSVNVSDRAKNLPDNHGRGEEAKDLARIMLKKKGAAALLLGDQDVCKITAVEALAKRLADGKGPKRLAGARIHSISLMDMLHSNPGEFGEIITSLIIKTIEHNRENPEHPVILHFPDYATPIPNLQDFRAYLGYKAEKHPELKLICDADPKSLAVVKHYQPDAITPFQKTDVKELSVAATLAKMEAEAMELHKHHGVAASGDALKHLIKETDLALPGSRPEKTSRILREAMAEAELNGDTELSKETINSLMTRKKSLSSSRDSENFLDRIKKRMETLAMSEEARKAAQEELDRLEAMDSHSSEYAVVRQHLDVLTSMPWGRMSVLNNDLQKTEDRLDADHYGMQKVKDAISEYVAVQNNMGKGRAPALCLVGPPGVGKTSLGKSIAEATGRYFVRMSLGGVHDESEMRGHRPTYVGAMPGGIIKLIRKADVDNPLFCLDEIDKLGRNSAHGDPAAALLEVLDPEQNHAFKDHYLGVDYDLSNVMFFCTANDFSKIPGPLRDRMEIIHLPGYLHDEKFHIAKRHLVPKQIKAKGLNRDLKDPAAIGGKIAFDDSALHRLISEYTQESGVRRLEQVIGKICRKAVREFAKGRTDPVIITADNIKDYLGSSRIKHDRIHDKDEVGLVTGLAFTEVGGCILPVQVISAPSKGPKLVPTGNLGPMIAESVTYAEGMIKNRARQFGITQKKLDTTELHVHFPGSSPKDGPSAGLAIATAIISERTGIPIHHDVAMTGAIDAWGNAKKIGGLPEKLEGALRAGVKTVIIPEENIGDLEDVPESIKEKLTIIPVSRIEEVLNIALTEKLKPIMEIENADDPAASKMKQEFSSRASGGIPDRDPSASEIRWVFNYLNGGDGDRMKAENDNTPKRNPLPGGTRKPQNG
jgi:ATP-dependent Lon protease